MRKDGRENRKQENRKQSLLTHSLQTGCGSSPSCESRPCRSLQPPLVAVHAQLARPRPHSRPQPLVQRVDRARLDVTVPYPEDPERRHVTQRVRRRDPCQRRQQRRKDNEAVQQQGEDDARQDGSCMRVQLAERQLHVAHLEVEIAHGPWRENRVWRRVDGEMESHVGGTESGHGEISRPRRRALSAEPLPRDGTAALHHSQRGTLRRHTPALSPVHSIMYLPFLLQIT